MTKAQREKANARRRELHQAEKWGFLEVGLLLGDNLPKAKPSNWRRTGKKCPRVRIKGSRLHVIALDGDGERFARVFGGVWRRIPRRDRRQIRTCPLDGLPEILLTNWRSDFRKINARGARARAQYNPFPVGIMYFMASVMDRLPKVVIESTIAHELAHVYLFATSGPGHTNPMAASPEEEDVGELAADNVARSWGFYIPPAAKGKP